MIGTYSCEKKLKSECIKTLNFADKSVVSGKFVFSSTLSLREAIDDLRTTDIELVEDKFERLYNEGFRSHKPIVGPDNIDLIKTLSMEKNDQLKDYYMKYPETKSDSQDENPLEFIPDPFFAAFVNENNEIIVNDTLYVITKNDGMYFAHINDSTHLYNYLNENGYGANSDNGSKSLSIEEDPCIVREEYGGVTEVDEEISRYIAPLDECYEEDPYYDGGNPPSYPETSVEEILQDRINNLPVMPASGANIIKNLFGDAFSTTVNFDDRNRIKTEIMGL